MNINELDLSQFEYLGSEINRNTSYVGFKDHFIYENLLVSVMPSINIKFYDKKLKVIYEEVLYEMCSKNYQLVTKHLIFAGNYTTLMNSIHQNDGRNIIPQSDIRLVFRRLLRGRTIDGLL